MPPRLRQENNGPCQTPAALSSPHIQPVPPSTSSCKVLHMARTHLTQRVIFVLQYSVLLLECPLPLVHLLLRIKSVRVCPATVGRPSLLLLLLQLFQGLLEVKAQQGIFGQDGHQVPVILPRRCEAAAWGGWRGQGGWRGAS